MIHSRDFSIKIYNGIYIWNQQELLYKMVYKLYDLVKVGRKPPLNGHGPLKNVSFCALNGRIYFKMIIYVNKYSFLLVFKCNNLYSRTNQNGNSNSKF
jgi:hypothetical protein